ncbi:hypothetical protein DVA67_025790 [Solirubrobacter sp. CPCC 204708]|uniref:DUF4129 domain-containing protein n=1 Tax=Solirubrobacter deserti TaxID=2282478 RepID=A0ABT4RFJ7_9ACTN|nr:hypothetical protein [Solirubrobacter deserti]MBE2319413.1 hypothetical protein [Solirubrobacter deserti]MDA0137302.1 hypothetical protein [Solirubrobacter deserti]
MDENVWSSLAGAARDVVAAIEAWFRDLGAIEFVLLVAIAWAIYWIWSTLRAITRLGPVEVAELEFGGKNDSKPDVKALTTLLRERLAKGGLLPPSDVPAGSPQTDLIAAVEGSGRPNADWIANLLKLLPHPPRSTAYKLSGTLIKGNVQWHLRYWMQPTSRGRSVMRTVSGSGEDEVIKAAAAEIFLELTKSAVHVFPQWARWSKPPAFRCYVDGLGQQGANARAAFEAASEEQFENLLPRLALANLEEICAGELAKTAAPPQAATAQAKAVRLYLDIGVAGSDVISARYRAGISASSLATVCQELSRDNATLTKVCKTVGLETGTEQPMAPTKVTDALHTLAANEVTAAWQLTGRFHILFAQGRLRHRYEPTGVRRRRLRRSIAIARHTLRARARRFDTSKPADLEMRWRRASVRWLHLGLLRASAGWNAHYNAGCFYALVHARAHGNSPADPQRSSLRRLRRRAYAELNLAIDQSGGALPEEWLSEGDRDLQSLRDVAEHEWDLILMRETGTPAAGGSFPEPAWGNPHRRRIAWYGLAVALVAAAVAVLVDLRIDDRRVLAAAGAMLVVLALATRLIPRLGPLFVLVVVIAGALGLLLVDPSEDIRRAVGPALGFGAAITLALLMARRAGTQADRADKLSIALWQKKQEAANAAAAAS